MSDEFLIDEIRLLEAVNVSLNEKIDNWMDRDLSELKKLEAENAELRANWAELRTFVTDEMSHDNAPNAITTALMNRLCGLCNVASNEQGEQR